jgi:TIR domain-containing protein
MAQSLIGHVFMSYSRADEEVMRRITTFLRNQGIKIWVDNEKLVPGTPIWEAEIEKAIIGANATIVIMSPDSKDSVWVRREISYSEQYRKRIFPVLVSGDEDSSVTLRLVTRQYVDIRTNEEIGLNRLSAALSFYLEELETQERKTREEAEKLARAEAERESAEHEAARLKLEREAAEKAAQQAEEKAAREKAKREVAEKVAREKVELEIVDKTQLESAEKSVSEIGEKVVKTASRRKALRLKKARETAERVALQNLARRYIRPEAKLSNGTKIDPSLRDPFIHSLWWFVIVIVLLIMLVVSLLSGISQFALY